MLESCAFTLETTVDGFETQIGVNYFGHAYLTSKLLDLVNRTGDPLRVVVVSSIAWTLLGNMSKSTCTMTLRRAIANILAGVPMAKASSQMPCINQHCTGILSKGAEGHLLQ